MVTLTGTFTRLDGTPATGTVKVTPSRSPIMDPDGKIVISGPQTFPLGVDGKLTVQIPASNDPDLGPPFTYWIDVNLTHASWKINKVWIPYGSATVDLSEIADYQPTPGVATRTVTIPADGADGQVLVWDGVGFSWDFPPEGPQGVPGEVTTAALTTALAGKVTGTGMTLRRDNSVGTRVLLDHPGGSVMLYGDTGWRNIPVPTDIPGAEPGGDTPLRVRRVGDVVNVIIDRITFTADYVAGSLVIPMGDGFRPRGFYLPHAGYPADNSRGWTWTGSGLTAQAGSVAFDARWSWTFTTSQPWPTVLPGVPS